MSNRIKEEFIQKKEPVRLNKYLSEAGVCSRREADRLIESGKVTVDGQRAQTGMKIRPGQEVRVGRKVVSRQDEMVVLAVNKPRGIVCTEEKRERNSIVRFLDYPIRVTYIGRLDKDSRGLLLMTNNGDIINRMMFGFNSCMLAMIVTEDGPAVCAAIDEAVDRGSTILKAYGGYKQERRDVVLCACSSKQLYEIEKLVKRMDPASFTIMLQANEVQGEGFRRLVLGKGEEKK